MIIKLKEIINDMKVVSQFVNLLLILYVLMIKNYESKLFSYLFLVFIFLNFMYLMFQIKKEKKDFNVFTTIISLVFMILIFYYLFRIFNDIDFLVSKIGLFFYGSSLLILFLYDFYLKIFKVKT